MATETEKGHDELVAEVIKRLEENDLYVKPEKCKWKVRKVNSRCGNRTRGDKDGEGESKRSLGMADAQVC